MSRATGLRVISVDYTTAPFAKWKQIQEQVLSVFDALLDQGFSMKDIALYGDSIGGGLTASTVLNLRDRGKGMPAAVVLMSPSADTTNAGDTMHTLENTDPSLHYDPLLKSSAVAFADGLDLTGPRCRRCMAISPKGFSPARIDHGRHEVHLPQHQCSVVPSVGGCRQNAKLDVYEGMRYVFQTSPAPETEVSLKKISASLHHHLEKP